MVWRSEDGRLVAGGPPPVMVDPDRYCEQCGKRHEFEEIADENPEDDSQRKTDNE